MIVDGFLASSDKVVGIYDKSYNKLFDKAFINSIDVDIPSKVPSHPRETKGAFSDAKIIEPIKINVSLLITDSSDQDTFPAIQNAYYRNDELCIQSRYDIYENMVIADNPHKVDSKSGATINLSLQQILLVTNKTEFQPKNIRDKDTVKKGVQSAKTVTSSFSLDIWNYIK